MQKGNLVLSELLGQGYNNVFFTNNKSRYRVLAGARNTKKSYIFTGLEIIFKILMQKERNVIVVRKTNSSNKNSTFSTLKYIIHLLDLDHLFLIRSKTMEVIRIDTHQVILYKGLDDPYKITSIRAEVGTFTDVYFEEAFEIDSFEDFTKIDGSIRGMLPKDYFFQITLLMNTWDKDHWIYEKFFKDRLEDDYDYLETHDYQEWIDENYFWPYGYGKGLTLHKSTYKINEFRDLENYDKAMLELKKASFDLYKVIALGMWGNDEEKVYVEFTNDNIFEPNSPTNGLHTYNFRLTTIGIDTGLSNGEGKELRPTKNNNNKQIRSATTMQLVGLTSDYNKLVCIDEFFHSNELATRQEDRLTEPELIFRLIDYIRQWTLNPKYANIITYPLLVYVDSADIGFRQGLQLEARRQNLTNIIFQPSTKIKIRTRIDFIRLLMAFKDFQVSTSCSNLIREIKAARKGDKGQARANINDHCLNANEYAWTPLATKLRRWKDFKEH